MITVEMSGKEEILAEGLWRYDYGETLEIIDNSTALEDGTEVDFYQGDNGTVRYLSERRVQIPDFFLLNALEIVAYIYIRSPSCGVTVKKVRLPIRNRPKPANTIPAYEGGGLSRLLPAGGAQGQYLAKKSKADFDVEWKDGTGEAERITDEMIDKLFE